MSKTNQIKFGSLLSYMQLGLSIVIGLIYTPLMIRFLGKSEYGLYNTVASTISTLSILSLGFNSSYIRYYSKYKKENNNIGINNLNGLFILIFSIIGVVALICGTFLTLNLRMVFSEGLNEAEYRIARILMILLTFNISISFPMSVFTNIISAHEEFIALKLAGVIRTVITPLIVIPLLYLGIRSIGIVLTTVLISLVVDVIYIYFVKFKLQCEFSFNAIEKGLFKEIFIFSGFIAINIIVDQVNNNLDKVIIGRFRGTEEVAVYSVGAALNGYFIAFSTAVSGLFTPRIHKIINEYKNDVVKLKDQITCLFVRVGRIQFIILSLVLTGVIFFGSPFIINIWAEPGYEDSYWVALLLMVPGIVPLIENVGIEVQRALNIHKYRSLIYGVMAIGNLIISIILCRKYGAVGSAIGTTVAVILANGIIMNIFYHKRCFINMKKFWMNILLLSRGLIIPTVIGIVLLRYINLNNNLLLFCGMGIYTLLFMVSMWLWGMNDYEKGLIKTMLLRVREKLKNR